MEVGSSETYRRWCYSVVLIGYFAQRVFSPPGVPGFVMMGAARVGYQRANLAAPIINRKFGRGANFKARGNFCGAPASRLSLKGLNCSSGTIKAKKSWAWHD
jgi:hypothetical protein